MLKPCIMHYNLNARKCRSGSCRASLAPPRRSLQQILHNFSTMTNNTQHYCHWKFTRHLTHLHFTFCSLSAAVLECLFSCHFHTSRRLIYGGSWFLQYGSPCFRQDLKGIFLRQSLFWNYISSRGKIGEFGCNHIFRKIRKMLNRPSFWSKG